MKICSFCEAQNEDWMEICQQCGNPLDKSTKKENGNEYVITSSGNGVENKDLKLVILVLSVILAILVIYTVFILT